MKTIVLTVFVLFMLTGCDKNDDIQNNSDSGIEFYLLKEYKTKENSRKIIENTVRSNTNH